MHLHAEVQLLKWRRLTAIRHTVSLMAVVSRRLYNLRLRIHSGRFDLALKFGHNTADWDL
eukprot:scaffold102542_cov36-Prasinocladus_malaysianus.AAC.1